MSLFLIESLPNRPNLLAFTRPSSSFRITVSSIGVRQLTQRWSNRSATAESSLPIRQLQIILYAIRCNQCPISKRLLCGVSISRHDVKSAITLKKHKISKSVRRLSRNCLFNVTERPRVIAIGFGRHEEADDVIFGQDVKNIRRSSWALHCGNFEIASLSSFRGNPPKMLLRGEGEDNDFRNGTFRDSLKSTP